MTMTLGAVASAHVTPAAGGAIRFTAENQQYTRTALGLGGSFTWTAWVKIGVNRGTYSFFLTQTTAGNGYWVGFGATGNTFIFDCVSGGGQSSNTAFTVGTWYYIAVVNNTAASGADPMYWKAAGAGSVSTITPQTGNIVGPSDTNTFRIGTDNVGDWFNGSIAAVKIWTTVLTQAEIDAEAATYAAVKTSGLWANYQFRAGPSLVDDSGLGRSLTAGAANPALDAAGPPIT